MALVAQDRVLTRRVRAMLANQGVAVRDETGWKLSTTRAAAGLMSLLRAAAWDEHEAMCNAIAQGDETAAAQLMLAHGTQAGTHLARQLLAAQPTEAPVNSVVR